MIDDKKFMVSFPVEVRFTARDSVPLSTSYGRPHWGKMHFQNAETLAGRYPEWDTFQVARRTIDPDGTFSSSYTRQIFGT